MRSGTRHPHLVETSLPMNARGFVLARDLRAAGRLGELRTAVAHGALERQRAGVYRAPFVPVASMSRPEAEAMRYLLAVRAVAETHAAPMFTGYSAVALHGLPLIGAWPSEVFTLSRDEHGHRRAGVISVARPRGIDLEHLALDGYLATPIEFSLIQLCRQAPLIGALTAVDAALLDRRAIDAGAAAPLTTIEALWSLHRRLLPYPRSSRVEAVLARATPRADTPLETLSRVTIEELGFPEPELQHEMWLPELGRRAVLDFHWPEYGIGAEADGRGKYLGDGSVQAGVDAVHREKQREDAVRHALRGFARWEWDHAWHRTIVDQRLRRAGLPIIRRPRTLR